MSKTKFTPENITELKDNEVFVFGSNVQGEHVGGAALFALKKFGAKDGQGFGLQGQSYAIPTCIRVWCGRRCTEPFTDVNLIKPYIDVFIEDAMFFGGKIFYVTKIGCGIAGFKVEEIAELFRPCLELENVILPKEFVDYLMK